MAYRYNGKEFTGRLGNYHSDYGGENLDGDGIGELEDKIGPNNTDYHPLLENPESYEIGSRSDQSIVDKYDKDDDGIESSEILTGISDWRRGDITSRNLLSLIEAWRGN